MTLSDIYRTIPSFPMYGITPDGKVWSKYSNKFIYQNTTDRYAIVSLSHNKKVKTVRVHRLVAENWVKGYKDSYIVDHKDHNKLNNNYKNLRWVSFKENLDHAIEHYAKKGINIRSGRKVPT